MAPNGKPGSYVMQHQRSPLQTVQKQATSNDQSVLIKNECILFSQSIMSGKWNPASAQAAKSASAIGIDGPEPRVLSKKRRDLINAEIRELQNLLPLKKSARERLSYLGILALTNTFIRKATFFKKECISCDSSMSCGLVPEFSASLSGFLLVFNREGKILYSSDNILDYLGNTVVELASQGDSIYDFVDKEDHDQVRSQLEIPPHDDRGEARRLTFFCRMSTSRYMKTQMRSWKNKIVHVTGRYHRPEMTNDWSDTVFFAVCTPVESKPVTDVRHHPSPRASEFKALHGPDMKFIEVPNTVESLLGYKPEELENTSWYQWIYPEDLEQAKQQHLKFVKEDGSTLACVFRMVKKDGTIAWVDITAEKSQESVASSFICNYILIDEEEVPYFRIHHNLLPFPDHYTEAQRQYLSYRSTLLSSALNSDASSTSTSPMTSPTGMAHADSSRLAMAQQVFGELDTKTILRRQLIKRKMSAVETPIGGVTTPYAPEMFGVQPNKMLIRSTSEMPYQAAGVYHVPLQHSTSFPDASYHTHMLYRGLSGEESYLAQLHSPTTSADYLFEGGYTTLTPVRQHTITFRPSQHSPVQSNESSSPVNGHSAQRNQNNNTQMGAQQYSNQYFANQYPTTQAPKSPARESAYYHPSVSPRSQAPPQSSSQQVTSAPRRSRRVSSIRRSVDGLFRDVNEIIDGQLVQETSTATAVSLTSSQAPTTSLNGSDNSPSSQKQSPQHSPDNNQAANESGERLPSLYRGWSQTSTSSSDVAQPTNLSLHPVKQEEGRSPQVTAQSTSPPQISLSQVSRNKESTNSPPQTYAAPSISQTSNEVQNYRLRSVDKPYHVQYSIASDHPSPMQQYQAAAAAFYAATQQNSRVDLESGVDLMKKYGNMSNMEMLFSESMVPPATLD